MEQLYSVQLLPMDSPAIHVIEVKATNVEDAIDKAFEKMEDNHPGRDFMTSDALVDIVN